MFVTILLALLLILGAGWLIVGPTSRTSVPQGYGQDPEIVVRSLRWYGLIPLVIAIVIALFTFTTIVQAKQVGVLTTFGKPSDRTLDSGLHLKWPWQSVTTIDGTVQTDEYRGEDCIYVRIGDGSRSCLSTTIRYRVVPEKANVVYADYRSDDPTESLRDAVVSTQFKSAAQAVLSEYNPIAGLEVVSGDNAAEAASMNFAPNYDQIATDLEDQMADRLGSDPLVEIQSISVSYLSLSESTQAKLDDFIAAVGDTRIAAQKRSTATQEAAANKTLSDSVSNNPGVLQSKCLDLLSDAIESGYALPDGWSCFGSGSPFVVTNK